MPSVKTIPVKENLAELKQLHKSAAPHLKVRVQMLILALQKELHSKYALAAALGVDANSIQNWKAAYRRGGLKELLLDKRGGKKPSLIDARTDKAIAAKLADSQEPLRSFTELQSWVDEHYLPGINYHTLRKHVKRKYGAKIKVVRKSHAQKDEQAVEQFKKK
jgi:transposase